MKTKTRIVGIISAILTTSLFAMQVKASGGEPIEGSQMEQFIQNITPDLEWVISRKYTDVAAKLNIDKAYYQGQELEQKELEIGSETALFELQRKEGDGAYELMEEEALKRWDEIAATVWGRKDSLPDFIRISISSIDEYGKLLAVAMPDNTGIVIYSMESGEELQYIDLAYSIDTDWPIEISQIKGNAESGWLVFSNGDITYRMTYPDGSTIRSGRCVWIQKDKLLQIVTTIPSY